MHEENDPENQARIDRIIAKVMDDTRLNEEKFDDQLLRLIGKMSVKFNTLERDFKYLLMLLRDDLPFHEARKQALKIKNAEKLLKEVCCHFRARFPDPALQKEFGEIYNEANAVREQRNLMLHSVWFWSSDLDKPFIRVKEDEADPGVIFDVPTIEGIIDRVEKCSSEAFYFFCTKADGYLQLLARLSDSQVFNSSSR